MLPFIGAGEVRIGVKEVEVMGGGGCGLVAHAREKRGREVGIVAA